MFDKKLISIGTDYTDAHLMARKRDPSSLGKPADLIDKTNNLRMKLKGTSDLSNLMANKKRKLTDVLKA